MDYRPWTRNRGGAYDASGGPYDDYGHGTHVAGLIASKGTPSQKACVGVAPRVRLVSLKVLDSEGRGATSTVIAALQFATQYRTDLGIAVLNLSLGHPIFVPAATDPLVQAVEAAVRAGIVVVVSAGNVGRNITTSEPGYAGILSPGNAPSAITVGARHARHRGVLGTTVPRFDASAPSPSETRIAHGASRPATAGRRARRASTDSRSSLTSSPL